MWWWVSVLSPTGWLHYFCGDYQKALHALSSTHLHSSPLTHHSRLLTGVCYARQVQTLPQDLTVHFTARPAPQGKLSLALSCWQQCLAADLDHTHSPAHILPALQNCCVVYKANCCAEAGAAMRRLELQVSHYPTPQDGYSLSFPLSSHRPSSARLPPAAGLCLSGCGRVREGACPLPLPRTAHWRRPPTAWRGKPWTCSGT